MAREGQGYPCYQRDMMMMMMIYNSILFYKKKILKNWPSFLKSIYLSVYHVQLHISTFFFIIFLFLFFQFFKADDKLRYIAILFFFLSTPVILYLFLILFAFIFSSDEYSALFSISFLTIKIGMVHYYSQSVCRISLDTWFSTLDK